MSHILLAVTGSYGDVNPFLGIGIALRKRGHDVTLIANAAFEQRARAAGLGFAATGSAEEWERVIADPRLASWMTAWYEGIRQVVLPNIKPAYRRIVELHRPGQTTLVTNGLSIGPRIAQERLGIPMATVLVWPTALPSVYAPPRYSPFRLGRFGLRAVYRFSERQLEKLVGPTTNAFRVEQGLPPVSRFTLEWWMSAQRIICLWPEWYAPKQPDWPQQTVLTGFPVYDGDTSSAEGWEMTRAIGTPSPAPILFTTGSVTPPNRKFFLIAAEVCRRLNRPGLFVTPHAGQVPEDLPQRVRHLREYVPFSKLLPNTAGVVHQGGIGTGSLALAAGVPQLIVPMAHDHFDTADRISQLGAGTSISGISFRPGRVAKALSKLLDSPTVRERCQYWKSQIDGPASIRRACELIEGLPLLSDGAP